MNIINKFTELFKYNKIKYIMKEIRCENYNIREDFSVDAFSNVIIPQESLYRVNFRNVYGNFEILTDKYTKASENKNHPNSPDYVEGMVYMGDGYQNSSDYNKIRKQNKRKNVIKDILNKSDKK